MKHFDNFTTIIKENNFSGKNTEKIFLVYVTVSKGCSRLTPFSSNSVSAKKSIAHWFRRRDRTSSPSYHRGIGLLRHRTIAVALSQHRFFVITPLSSLNRFGPRWCNNAIVNYMIHLIALCNIFK